MFYLFKSTISALISDRKTIMKSSPRAPLHKGFLAIWIGIVLLIGVYLVSQLFPVYHPPDHFLHLSFAMANHPAKDGMSALYFAMLRLTQSHLSIGILLPISLTLSGLFLLGYWVIKECHQRLIPPRDIIILLATLLSLGCWYFVSGRVYSDFPPTIFNFSLALLALQKAQSKTPNTIWWPIHFILLGLTASWKSYNAFLVGPTLVLTTSLFITSSTRSWYRSLCIVGFSVVVGLLVGFYQFFNQPIQTLMGIRGYSEQVDFDYLRWLYVWTPQPFFHRQVWDHVFLPPITLSALPFPFLMTLLWVTFQLYRPIFWICSTTLLAFSLFIFDILPGYPWHAFPISIGLYTCLVFSIFLNRNTPHARIIMTHIKVGTLASALVVFGWYVPHEVAIQMGIKRAIGRLNAHSSIIQLYLLNHNQHYPTHPIIGLPLRYSATHTHPINQLLPAGDQIKLSIPPHKDGFLLVLPSFKNPLHYWSNRYFMQLDPAIRHFFITQKWKSFVKPFQYPDSMMKEVLYQSDDLIMIRYRRKTGRGLGATHPYLNPLPSPPLKGRESE